MKSSGIKGDNCSRSSAVPVVANEKFIVRKTTLKKPLRPPFSEMHKFYAQSPDLTPVAPNSRTPSERAKQTRVAGGLVTLPHLPFPIPHRKQPVYTQPNNRCGRKRGGGISTSFPLLPSVKIFSRSPGRNRL